MHRKIIKNALGHTHTYTGKPTCTQAYPIIASKRTQTKKEMQIGANALGKLHKITSKTFNKNNTPKTLKRIQLAACQH